MVCIKYAYSQDPYWQQLKLNPHKSAMAEGSRENLILDKVSLWQDASNLNPQESGSNNNIVWTRPLQFGVIVKV